MKNLIRKAVLCSDWLKIASIIALIFAGSFLQGCGVVKGVGQAVGFACQGVGAIGKGINADLTAASDGHSDQYYSNRKK